MSDRKWTTTKKATECPFTLNISLTSSVAWSTRTTIDEGGLQQFALVGSGPHTTTKIPDNITEDEAATIPTALNTASVALYDNDGFGFPSPFEGGDKFGNGKSILVLGGSSVIGLVGILPLVAFVANPSASTRSSFRILSNHCYSPQET